MIVLGILGILAEMTIPGLISRFEDQAIVTALKKEVSVIQQAITMAVLEEGPIENWYSGTDEIAATAVVNTILSKYLKITKNCGPNTGCLPQYKALSKTYTGTFIDYENTTDGSFSKMQLADGSIVFVYVYLGIDSINTIYFYIDMNGQKGPNRLGYDLFTFKVLNSTYYKSHTMTPYGNINYTLNSAKNRCDSTAKNVLGDGMGCATWVYYMGNRDYLYCQGLGPTKTKCD